MNRVSCFFLVAKRVFSLFVQNCQYWIPLSAVMMLVGTFKKVNPLAPAQWGDKAGVFGRSIFHVSLYLMGLIILDEGVTQICSTAGITGMWVLPISCASFMVAEGGL